MRSISPAPVLVKLSAGVYILPLNFKIAPKVRGALAENFYICPSLHNAIFKNLPILCYFLANFWKNWQILIKLYLKYQNYWKKLGILDKFLKKLVNLCNFFLFLPFYCSKYFISAPPPQFVLTDILYTTDAIICSTLLLGLNLLKYWWFITHSLPRHGWFLYLTETFI